jgi:hypothetical protein
MRAVKSNARKQNTGLTVPQATREARRLTDKLMSGQGVTVESRHGALEAGTPTIVTHITYPETADASDVALEVETLAGYLFSHWSTCSITITRTVK